MNRKMTVGILFGGVAGILDVVPMLIQKLTWNANIAAFSMWVVIGFLIPRLDLKLPPAIKGIVVSFLVLLPTAVLIAWEEPFSLLPVSAMTLLLGGSLGFAIDKATRTEHAQ